MEASLAVAYVRGGEDAVHAEFKAFRAAHPDAAGNALAILHHLAIGGFSSLDTGTVDSFGVARPYCLQAENWGVFFEIEGPRKGACAVRVLLVSDFAGETMEAAKRRAIGRRDAAGEGT